MYRIVALFISALLFASHLCVSVAQEARSGGGNVASAQLLQQMQQLASERTALQAENARLKAAIEGTKRDRDAMKRRRDAANGRIQMEQPAKVQGGEKETSKEKELTQAQDRLKDLQSKFNETIATFRDAKTKSEALSNQLVTRDTDLATCMERNAQLYAISGELLAQLDRRTVADPLRFERDKRHESEALVSGYMSDIAESPPKVTPAVSGAAAP